MKSSIRISASILSADFGKLNSEIQEVEPFVDMLHVDVMDGHFVPNLTIGPAVVKCINTKLPVDVHLMISDPGKYAPEFSGHCQMISFHAELFSREKLAAMVKQTKKLGVKVGLALNPDKPISLLEPVIDKLDYILIMSVFAGFGGQKFIPETIEKIRALRARGFSGDIEVDGGINPDTIHLAYEAGANIFVAGNAIFGQADRKKAVRLLRQSLMH
ncbi:MAG: ribulose-phosphate 3-epimerase [Nanoarchaeota archaeon]|nr:ribulose-phosphate 3-epimerase [Nanoarchaeota archaeon]